MRDVTVDRRRRRPSVPSPDDVGVSTTGDDPRLPSPPMPVSLGGMPVSLVTVVVLVLSLLGWTWPVDGRPGPPTVVAAFDPPTRDWLSGHRGVDLQARPGAPVRAAGPGVVVHAGQVANRGVVSVAHPTGVRTTYEPVLPEVSVGQVVRAGQIVGSVAAWASPHRTCPSGGCLHWGARVGQVYVDPVRLVEPPPVRLLPGPPVTTGVSSGAGVGLTVRRAQTLDRYVRVPLGGRDGRVPQQLLDRAQVRATLE